MIESILLSAAPVATFVGQNPLTNASGFFFERDDRLFLVTSRHIMIDAPSDLPWMLLGVHSARLDVGSREVNEDEALGLNCAWFADILMTLTEG